MPRNGKLTIKPYTKVPDHLSRREEITKNINWERFVLRIASGDQSCDTYLLLISISVGSNPADSSMWDIVCEICVC